MLLAVGFALTVESVGFYLPVEAHSALLSGQSAGLPRYGLYLVGLVVGGFTARHFLPVGLPAALAFGERSASPILCGIYPRTRWRTRLVAPGLAERRRRSPPRIP